MISFFVAGYLDMIFFQLDTSTESNQVVVEDADFSYTATYLDLEQVRTPSLVYKT